MKARVGRAASGLRSIHGTSVVELVVLLAVAGIVLQIATPSLVRWRHQRLLHAAAWSLTVATTALRSAAASDGAIRGVVFDRGDSAGWRIFSDGDGDGLRRTDMAALVDSQLQPPVRLAESYPGVEFGLPGGRKGLDGRVVEEGVRFGRSSILSFAPEGTSSTGTVYLSNSPGDAVAVRFYGPTGRVSVWRSDGLDRAWRRLW